MSCGGGHLGFPIGIKNLNFVEDLPMIIPGQFGFNCPSGFWSSTKCLFFVPDGYSTWLPGPIICSDWLKFQRSSSLKLMN
jgi:hypothetical protein